MASACTIRDIDSDTTWAGRGHTAAGDGPCVLRKVNFIFYFKPHGSDLESGAGTARAPRRVRSSRVMMRAWPGPAEPGHAITPYCY